MTILKDYFFTKKEELKEDLLTLTRAESPTPDKQMVDECGQVLAGLFKQHLGVEPEVFKQDVQGDHLKFKIGKGKKKVLILVHFDTVWDAGRLPIVEKEGKLYGPGVFDMKSGIIQALWAVKGLVEVEGGLEGLEITFLCTSDEEIGSVSSRDLIEETAKMCDVVLVTEAPVHGSGALKTSRNGVGIYELTVKGHSSHAGSHHADGISAVKELAHQIIKLEGMTDYSIGTTVNIGVIEGGTRLNVVPDSARCTIDFRVKTKEEGERMVKAVESLEPLTEGAKIEVEGGLNRPPMERTEATAHLFGLARDAAREIGFELEEAHIGGGSDGNFTAGLGIPTIDGFGCYGDGAHAEHEHIVLDELPKRAALIAYLLKRLAAE
ncbi:M20 family metallopeptidase [Salipaludibacillus sp. CUR1]|uniref:M20 family metallopeptidase n=1 Tax=Salipaludibacillus sp. CUR1 TaxID=2820003 RepID=UPI001E36BE95|nr:M20 family metallopeptidase [Salipaludibacillus sp. CUR1]MCE7791675.1 M20 family metallopeptidase [Salipaludibacillus sp. CUR1]